MENIMEFGEEMKQRIAEAFSEDMRKDISLNDADVTKINDQKLKGISFKRSNSEAAPTIYLNKYFDQYMRGRSVEDIRNEIVDVYMNTLSEKTPEMSPQRMDFDEMTNISIKTQTVLRTEIWTSPYFALICTCACATFSHMHSI